MATSKWLQIDGVEYQVPIVDLQRKGDILDLTANRTEDGVLHRDVIGTYYNYTLNIGRVRDQSVNEALWWALTAPVASHQVQLPYQPEPFEGYFGSCKDNITLIDANGQKTKGLSFNLIATRPSRNA
jgi:hypothetical protein